MMSSFYEFLLQVNYIPIYGTSKIYVKVVFLKKKKKNKVIKEVTKIKVSWIEGP